MRSPSFRLYATAALSVHANVGQRNWREKAGEDLGIARWGFARATLASPPFEPSGVPQPSCSVFHFAAPPAPDFYPSQEDFSLWRFTPKTGVVRGAGEQTIFERRLVSACKAIGCPARQPRVLIGSVQIL
jgi:hypothetical protein